MASTGACVRGDYGRGDGDITCPDGGCPGCPDGRRGVIIPPEDVQRKVKVFVQWWVTGGKEKCRRCPEVLQKMSMRSSFVNEGDPYHAFYCQVLAKAEMDPAAWKAEWEGPPRGCLFRLCELLFLCVAAVCSAVCSGPRRIEGRVWVPPSRRRGRL